MDDNRQTAISSGQLSGVALCLLVAPVGLSLGLGNSLGRSVLLLWLAALVLSGLVYLLLPFRMAANPPGRLRAGAELVYLLAMGGLFLAALVRLWLDWTQSAIPFAVYAALLALLLAYAAHLGLRAVWRLSVLIAAVLLVMTVADSLLLTPQMRLSRLSGVVMPSFDDLWRPGCLLLALLLWPLPLLPALRRQADIADQAARRGLHRGVGLAGLWFLLAVSRNLLVLGELMQLDRYPLLRVLKMVEVGVGLSRLEYFGLLALTAAAAVGLMAVSALARQQLDRLSWPASRHAAPLCGLLLFGLALAWRQLAGSYF